MYLIVKNICSKENQFFHKINVIFINVNLKQDNRQTIKINIIVMNGNFHSNSIFIEIFKFKQQHFFNCFVSLNIYHKIRNEINI